MLIKDAYGVENKQISGVPSWLNSEKYEIDAKMDSSAADALRRLSEDQRKLEKQRMLRLSWRTGSNSRSIAKLESFPYMHWSLQRTAPNFTRLNLATRTRRDSNGLAVAPERALRFCDGARS